jgi:hypothetical protein
VTGEKPNYMEKTCPSATLSSRNPRPTGLGSNSGLCIERLLANHLTIAQLKEVFGMNETFTEQIGDV